jgi:hypothetical protein
MTEFGVKQVHESNAVVHDISATITASKSWIPWERSLRFKDSPTIVIAELFSSLSIRQPCRHRPAGPTGHDARRM